MNQLTVLTIIIPLLVLIVMLICLVWLTNLERRFRQSLNKEKEELKQSLKQQESLNLAAQVQPLTPEQVDRILSLMLLEETEQTN